jgi:hypothetical protein
MSGYEAVDGLPWSSIAARVRGLVERSPPQQLNEAWPVAEK